MTYRVLLFLLGARRGDEERSCFLLVCFSFKEKYKGGGETFAEREERRQLVERKRMHDEI
jgi:hypothetical protein